MWRFKSKFLVFDDFHLFGNDADQAWNDLSPSTWIRSSVSTTSMVSWSWFDWRSIEASVVICWLFVCGGETVPVEHWPPSRAWHRTLEASKPSIVTNASRAGQGQNWESHQTQPHVFVVRPKKWKPLRLNRDTYSCSAPRVFDQSTLSIRMYTGGHRSPLFLVIIRRRS